MEWKLFGIDLEKQFTKRGRLRARELSPARDWLFLLVASVALFIALAIYDVLVLLEVNRGIAAEQMAPPRSSFDEAALDDVLKRYRDRERENELLRFTPVTLPDPSV
jgi:hypothetical protein